MNGIALELGRNTFPSLRTGREELRNNIQHSGDIALRVVSGALLVPTLCLTLCRLRGCFPLRSNPDRSLVESATLAFDVLQYRTAASRYFGSWLGFCTWRGQRVEIFDVRIVLIFSSELAVNYRCP